MKHTVKIGTRESELAVWQAKKVQALLAEQAIDSSLLYIKSEGDINLTVPLYEIGVQGIFTKALDSALLQKEIDVAVHSYKDVPTQPAKGIVKAAVLKRDSYKDILIYKAETAFLEEELGFWNGPWARRIWIRAPQFSSNRIRIVLIQVHITREQKSPAGRDC